LLYFSECLNPNYVVESTLVNLPSAVIGLMFLQFNLGKA